MTLAIGFIGLGAMGEPMAANLARKGFSVTVWNRTPGKAEELKKLGAKEASSPAEAVREADVVITMLSNDDVVRGLYLGEEGILSAVRSGAALIDNSTISPVLAKELAKAASGVGCGFLDCPVTGSTPAAIGGTLVFMVGGEASLLERVRPVLDAMGSKIVHVGPSGSGSVAKLGHNSIVAINNLALAEGLSIAVSGGLDPAKFLDIVRAGSAGSKAAELKSSKLLEGDYSVQFSLELMLKDLRLASVYSDSLNTPTPMLEAAKSLFQAGSSAGYDKEDLIAVSKLYEQWIGRRLGGEAQTSAK
ncbi:NAD(P)-dependent oxidoreductase [Paenibacillus pasadenensis]|uniref:NAD(P)-dependent oxidoreductase n=1 Tax=Paenibacillus pasadenensis TaxID=217090 RepID=UPI00203D09CB|nr:NAD(P)-dependent oxidoreductase [Paenibacillus pasadenensis]MCM3749826.1 NAD(P)-dependent oxidoreductase [Paenibacillus pasadenensis]